MAAKQEQLTKLEFANFDEEKSKTEREKEKNVKLIPSLGYKLTCKLLAASLNDR